MRRTLTWLLCGCLLAMASVPLAATAAEAVMPGLDRRFAGTGELPQEVPDFQKHVSPLLGRLGCNGRACHGSFQGRGGFRLSLFGYDFNADHEALMDPKTGRVDLTQPEESLVLTKPVDADLHEGGKRFDLGSWQDRVLRKWIQAGAKFERDEVQKLVRLEVTPSSLHFSKLGDAAQLRAVAVWQDGTQEDVTSLCRFQSNDTSLVEISESGAVRCGESRGDSHVVVFYDNAVVPVPVVRPVSEAYGNAYPQVAARTKVDALVIDKLKQVGILPSDRCDDATFLRRVSLDLAATLPTPRQVEAFVADSDPAKREKLVDTLLESEGYAAWWSTKLCDWTGNNPAQMVNSVPGRNASKFWYEWVYRRVADNISYDKIAEGMIDSASRNDGESFEQYCVAMSEASRDPEKYADREGLSLYWSRNNFRTTEDRAVGFAYAFLGLRIQCAQCHKHPFDQWAQADFQQFERLFSQVQYNGNNVDGRNLPKEERELLEKMLADLKVSSLRGNDLRNRLQEKLREGEVVPFSELTVRASPARPDKTKAKEKDKNKMAASYPTGQLLGGATVSLADDTRDDLVAWLRSPENPYFAKAFVNRAWAHYFSVGIVNPPDDLNLANPPSNAPLLDYLARGFIDSGFDMKWVHRTIVLSDTYQRSCEPNATNVHDRRNFSHYLPRRLPAEILYDAVVTATSGEAKFEKLVSQREGRAVAIPDLDLTRNRNDDTGYAMGVFGRSTRESNCDCDRSADPSLLQTVFLRNDKAVLACLANRDGWVAETCKEIGVAAPQAREGDRDNPAVQRQIASLEAQEKALVKQIAKLKKDASGADRSARIEQRLATIREQLAKLEPTRQADAAAVRETGKSLQVAGAPIEPGKASEIVRDAYLRTLSRVPTAEELNRSLAYIANSASAAEGIEGVMWALVNTKEFSVNH